MCFRRYLQIHSKVDLNSWYRLLTSLTISSLLTSLNLPAQDKTVAPGNCVSKASCGQPYVLMNANNVTSWIRSDGFYNWLVKQSWNGEFPKDSGVGTIFSEGIVFGGKVHDGLYTDSIRVTGDTYQVGMQAGAIKSDAFGNTIGADDPNDISFRAFAIRPDMPLSIQDDTASWPDLRMDAATYFQKSKDSVTIQDICQIAGQYFTDWKEWPAKKGAPWFEDNVKIVRNDAAFDPNSPHDIPGVPDAAKTIWYVCNDLNPAVTSSFAGSHPTGIEEQVTTWAYDSLQSTFATLNNAIFKQMKLIYRGNVGSAASADIDSMYICQWVDGDLGYGGDDFGGCDTMLNLAFNYNSKTFDSVYSKINIAAPASGYVYLQGTSHRSDDPRDSAIVNFHWRNGYKYWTIHPMSVFFNKGSGMAISDADIGPYSGTLQWYNFFRGVLPRPSYPSSVPFWLSSQFATSHSISTPYLTPGDPFTGQGWVDGFDIPPGDRRFFSIHGPFSLKLHDTAEVVIAHVDAIGASNLWSIEVLKYSVEVAQYWYNGMIAASSYLTSAAITAPPYEFEVSQNYPNPFNPSTTITYQVPMLGRVVIKVFNVLGQQIETLVDQQKQAGTYKVEWNASEMPSGVYFCRTELTPRGGKKESFRDVKKMLLIK